MEIRKLILASASPRRRDLMTEAGYVFEVIPSQVEEENILEGLNSPRQVAKLLAYHKARNVAAKLANHTPAVVLGADTIVVCEDRILGKASDERQAKEMLHKLSRTKHQVITGVALVESPTSRTLLDAETSRITMTPMSEQEIQEYIATGSWIDKAGAYAVQEGADKFIEKIDGSYTNVVGLPMELVARMLQAFSINPKGV